MCVILCATLLAPVTKLAWLCVNGKEMAIFHTSLLHYCTGDLWLVRCPSRLRNKRTSTRVMESGRITRAVRRETDDRSLTPTEQFIPVGDERRPPSTALNRIELPSLAVRPDERQSICRRATSLRPTASCCTAITC